MKNLKTHIENIFEENLLIGNHDFTDEEYSQMLDYVQEFSRESSKKLPDKFLFATLVEIAKRWRQKDDLSNNEENIGYWHYVFKVLFNSRFDQKLYQEYTKSIRRLGELQKIPVVNTGQKYYATIMMHAFAPASSMDSFFDLCFKIFKEDLDYGFTNEDVWLCDIIADQMRSVLDGGYKEDKLVSIGSSAYSIKIGLRSFVLDKALNAEFIKFTKVTLYRINALFNREQIEVETRIDNLLIDWWKRKIETELITDKKSLKRKLSTVTKQNISVKFIRDNDKVFLSIPPIRVENVEDNMQLAIYVNGISFSVQEMRTRRGELVYTTVPLDFDLNGLVGSQETDDIELRVEILENDTVIFDSEKSKSTSLIREFILFDNEKEVFGQMNAPGNYFVYSRGIDNLKQVPEDLRTFGKNLYNIYANAGENLIGETKQIFFTDKTKRALETEVCLIGNLPDIEWILDDISCLVFRKSVKLMIPKSHNLKALELKIDNKHYKLNDFECESTELSYQFGLKSLGLFSERYPSTISLFCFETEKEILSESVIVLPELQVNFNRTFYYGDVEKSITVGNKKEMMELSWSNQENEITCPYNEGFLVIRVPYLKWRINDGNWYNEPINQKLWYKDFVQNGDRLEIDFPRDNEIISISGEINGQYFEVEKNQNGTYEIGRGVYTNENQTNILFHININEEKFKLFNIATKEHFTGNPLIYNDGSVFWNVENTFIGNNQNVFLLDIGGKKVFRGQLDGTNKKILDSLNENLYRVTIKRKSDNIFLTDWEPIYQGELLAGDPKKFRFKNKRLILFRARCHDDSPSWLRFIPEYFIDNIEYVQDEENLYYRGRLCVVGRDGNPIVLNNLKDENDSYTRVNPVRIELRNNSTLWLVAGYKGGNNFLGELFYDRKRKGICNIARQDEFFGQINLYKFKEEDNV